MSAVVGTISSSQNTGISFSSNIKKEAEHKTDKTIDSLGFDENTDICKDLIKEITKKTDEDNSAVLQREDDACLKSEDSKKDEQTEKNDKV